MHKDSKFLLQQFTLLLLGFIILKVVFPVGGNIDLALIHPWLDQHGVFFLKDNWWLDQFAHRYVKDAIISFYTVIFILWLASFKLNQLKRQRYQLGFFFWISMLGTISIGIFKSQSPYACPWDMTSPTNSGFIWNFMLKNGHCFPGGHASCGFALLTGYFVYKQSQPKYAYFYLSLGLVLGFAMGWTQMMRGAHFISHNLWTLWLMWLINTLAYSASQYFFALQHKRQTLSSSHPADLNKL